MSRPVPRSPTCLGETIGGDLQMAFSDGPEMRAASEAGTCRNGKDSGFRGSASNGRKGIFDCLRGPQGAGLQAFTPALDGGRVQRYSLLLPCPWGAAALCQPAWALAFSGSTSESGSPGRHPRAAYRKKQGLTLPRSWYPRSDPILYTRLRRSKFLRPAGSLVLCMRVRSALGQARTGSCGNAMDSGVFAERSRPGLVAMVVARQERSADGT